MKLWDMMIMILFMIMSIMMNYVDYDYYMHMIVI